MSDVVALASASARQNKHFVQLAERLKRERPGDRRQRASGAGQPGYCLSLSRPHTTFFLPPFPKKGGRERRAALAGGSLYR